MPVISIAAEKIFSIGSFAVTNSLLLAVLAALVLIIAALFIRTNMREVPGRLQGFFELFLEGALSLMDSILGSREKSERYLPLVATIFLFVVVSNWLGLMPGVGSLGVWEEHHAEKSVSEDFSTSGEEPVSSGSDTEPSLPAAPGAFGVSESVGGALPEAQEPSGSEAVHSAGAGPGVPLDAGELNAEGEGAYAGEVLVPLFRAPAADLNFTIALGIIAVGAVNLFGVFALGFRRHASKFFTIKNPVASFTGILEFLSEFVRIVSFSFRLFGNVFAGEVLLVIVGFLVPYLIPLPFLFLEVFVGFIQALIFSMLTLVFIATATSEEGAH
jgi:F-type H+-transporting ATPase subunit a